MPQYVFLCLNCNREFTQMLQMADLEKGGISCPHCGSKQVTRAVATFSGAASKRS